MADPTNNSALVVPADSGMAATNTLRDIKPPVEIPGSWAWLGWVALALLVLAIIAAIVVWLTLRKRRVQPPPVPVTPPHEVARRRLQDALALLDQPRPFCTEVSDTIRIYLENRFHLRAPERTTEEFLAELQDSPLLTPDQELSLGDFLQSCDLVKFARYEPNRPELDVLWNSASRLIDETEPAPVREPGPASQPGEAA
jgi:hypothetical protein